MFITYKCYLSLANAPLPGLYIYLGLNMKHKNVLMCNSTQCTVHTGKQSVSCAGRIETQELKNLTNGEFFQLRPRFIQRKRKRRARRIEGWAIQLHFSSLKLRTAWVISLSSLQKCERERERKWKWPSPPLDVGLSLSPLHPPPSLLWKARPTESTEPQVQVLVATLNSLSLSLLTHTQVGKEKLLKSYLSLSSPAFSLVPQ